MKKFTSLFILLSVVLSIFGFSFSTQAATASAFTVTNVPITDFFIGTVKNLIMDIALPNPALDTIADCDGSATTGAGTCSAAAGTALFLLVNADNLCADSKTAPLVIFKDSDGDCNRATGVITNILNTTGAGTLVVNADKWAHTVSGAYATTGQELYVDVDGSLFKNADKLSSVTVSNLGTADDNELTAIRIYQESGVAGFDPGADTEIGSDTATPFLAQVITTGSSTVYVNGASLTTSNRRIYIAVDISGSAFSTRNFQARIVAGATTIAMTQSASTNNGPTDAALTNTSLQSIVRSSTPRKTAPISTITSPASGSVIIAGQPYIIKGQSIAYSGASIQLVEVSLDNGVTWFNAVAKDFLAAGFAWEYVWLNPIAGSYTLKTRATDWLGNQEAPVSVTVTVAALAPVVITPAVPAVPVAPAVPTITPAVPAVVVVPAAPALKVPSFVRHISRGVTGDDVKNLQTILKQDSEIYPEGLVTGFFGLLTRSAVVRFQLKHAIISSATDDGAGLVGPKTRKKLNELYAK